MKLAVTLILILTASITTYAQQQLYQNMIRSGKSQEAAQLLYSRSQRPDMQKQIVEIRFWLGVALQESRFPQLAAIQYVDVVRRGKSPFLKPAIDRLALLADRLGDETILNYALSKVLIEDIPSANRDIIRFRLGERSLREGKFPQATQSFSSIPSNSRYFFRAQFNRGLSLLEAGKPSEAVAVYQNLLALKSKSPVTDPERVSAHLALARSYYQAQDWEKSIENYRKVPRDSNVWSDALFESSWAYFRAAKFRSALGQFHSLHSPYYENHFQPEALILRGLVYLYICQFDEMEKTLGFFDKTYLPVLERVQRFLKQNADPVLYADEISKEKQSASVLPLLVTEYLKKEADVREQSEYLKKVIDERNRVDGAWGRTPLGNYSRKALEARVRAARFALGDLVKFRLQALVRDLQDLVEQASLAKYEMIGGKKEKVKKRIAGNAPLRVDQNVGRSFYIQNGFEYWPFKGEYWLNEIGNYKYIGTPTCE